MKRCPPLWFRAAWAALLVSLFAVSGFAQLQTGNIYGVVEANDGSALPGVTVTLSGVGAPTTTVTDAQGRFRFLNLSPGSYTLKAELAGYGTATRSGLSVNIGRNADVTMTLNPSVTQTITVTAEAPLLDVRRTGTGASITKVELEKVPTGRDPWVILQQTPGVLMDRVNVGGNESGQQSQYVGKGSTGDQSTWNVDGVNITDVGALGSSPTYYDFDSFEEMQVTTGGTDVRIQTPGVQLNMVTKRGTNDLRGSARYFNTNGDWQSNPSIPDEASAYLTRVNEIDNINDWGLEAGGPILRDRLWLWGAYSKQNIDLLSATLLSSGARFLDKTELETYNGKLNAQLGAANSLSLAAMLGNKVKIGRNVGPTRAPETAWNQDSSYDGPTMWKLEDTHVFGPNFYLTGLYSEVQGGFQLIADAGKGCQTIECASVGVPPPLFDEDLGSSFRNFYSYQTERPQTQYRADASTFFTTGSLNHELKFGLGFREAEVSSLTVFPGGQFVNANASQGAYLVGLYRNSDFIYNVDAMDLYVGDTMMVGRLTLQAGLRYDSQKGSVQAGSQPANPVIPDVLTPISFGGSTEDLEWTSISPRIGLTYALGSEKRTLLRAAANRYVDQMGGATVYATSPLSYGYLYYYMVDLNHDKIAQPGEICKGAASDPAGCAALGTGIVASGGSVDPNNPGSAIPTVRWDPDINPPHTDEFIFGAESEVMTNLSIGGNLTYRRLNDFIETRYEKHRGAGDFYTRADYLAGGAKTASCSGANCGPYGSYTVTYYTLADYSGLGVITNREDYSQTYTGIELNATKRMADRWMLRGNFSWNDWSQDVGDKAFADPTRLRTNYGCTICDGGTVVQGSGAGSGAKGGVYINAEWAYTLTGVYQIPVIETSFGFNLVGREGYPIPYAHRVTTSEGFKFILVDDDPAERRHEDLTTLDLRLAKDFRFMNGGLGITVSADVFNVFNEQTILQRNTRLGIASGNRITELLSPRVFRLGARLTF